MIVMFSQLEFFGTGLVGRVEIYPDFFFQFVGPKQNFRLILIELRMYDGTSMSVVLLYIYTRFMYFITAILLNLLNYDRHHYPLYCSPHILLSMAYILSFVHIYPAKYLLGFWCVRLFEERSCWFHCMWWPIMSFSLLWHSAVGHSHSQWFYVHNTA